jgi:hypothetical protein
MLKWGILVFWLLMTGGRLYAAGADTAVSSGVTNDQTAKNSASGAQDKTTSTAVEDIFESLKEFPMIQAVLEAPFTYLYLGDPQIRGVVFSPSFAPRLGARLAWKNLGATLTLGLPIPDNEEERRGHSPQTNLIFNSYWRQHALDVYYQRYKSFYVSSPGRELSVHKPKRYPQLPDARLLSFGLNWYYAANPEAYSFRAAFDFTEFQTKSGGSWLLNPFYNHSEISLGGRLIAGIGDDSITEIPKLASGRFDTFGTGLGYGYTLILSRYFASALATVGPGLQVQHVERVDGANNRAYNLSWKINTNFSAGWNSKRYVVGVKLLFDSLTSRVAAREFSTNLVAGQLFFGGRF